MSTFLCQNNFDTKKLTHFRKRIKLPFKIIVMCIKKYKHADTLRDKIGMSQEEMALFLGISRSSLSMSECDERTLSVAAIIKEKQLGEALASEEQPPSMKTANEVGIPELAKDMQKRIAECQYEIKYLERKLGQIRAECAKVMNGVKVSGILLAKLPNTETAKTDRISLEAMEAEAMRRLYKCGQAAQIKLQFRMEVLTFELNTASNKLAELVLPTSLT